MTRQDFKSFLLTYLHKPYLWGGDDPLIGLDCSGFAQECLAALGADPAGDQTAHALRDHCLKYGTPIMTPPDTGDLVFYGTQGKIIHIAVGFHKGIVIEAGGGGSRTKTLQDAINQNAFIRLRPYRKRLDFVATYRLPLGLED